MANFIEEFYYVRLEQPYCTTLENFFITSDAHPHSGGSLFRTSRPQPAKAIIKKLLTAKEKFLQF